jgi:hypothetical protein
MNPTTPPNSGSAEQPSSALNENVASSSTQTIVSGAAAVIQTPTTSIANSADRPVWKRLAGFVFGVGYTTEDFDLSYQRKRTRYFGILGFLILICFGAAIWGLHIVFDELIAIVSTPCCLLNENLVSAKLKILAPLFGGFIFVVIASLLTLAKISQPLQKNKDEQSQFNEIPSLILDLLKGAIGWLKKRLSD